MANQQAPRDSNQVPTLLAVDDTTGFTVPVPVDANGNLLIAATIAGGGGTVTSVSVTTANGVSGVVATATTTPAITFTLGAITPTSVNGNVFTTGSSTYTGTAGQTYTFPTTSATIARTDAANTFTGVQTMTSPALTTPAITGLATGSGVSDAATASTLVVRDANANTVSNDNIIGWTTTATAAGTTTMTIASTPQQYWTGSSAQTIKLPTTSVAAGQRFQIVNQSTGLVTVQSSGANTILILGASTSAFFTALVATPTTAANWSASYAGVNAATGKVATINNTITFAGTDATTMTFPTTSATIARTDAANTFTGVQSMTSPDVTTSLTTPSTTFALVNATATTVNFAGAATTMAVGATTALITIPGNIISTSNAITASGNAATVPITRRISTVTNNSAATLTITLTTAGAVDGQMVMVRVLDFSAVAQTITWVNTENSTVTAPTTSNGSTTLPLTVGFQYNNATSKWRCIASA